MRITPRIKDKAGEDPTKDPAGADVRAQEEPPRTAASLCFANYFSCSLEHGVRTQAFGISANLS